MRASSARGAGRAVALALIGVLIAACGVSVPPPPLPTPQRDACSDFELDVDRFWSRDAHVKVKAGILQAGGSIDEVVVERVVTKMDQVSRDWVMMQESVCRDTVVRKVTPPEVYTKVSLCLRTALVSQRTVVEMMRAPTQRQVYKLDETLAAIGTDVASCQKEAVYAGYDARKRDDKDSIEAREALGAARAYDQLADKARLAEAIARGLGAAKRANDARLIVDLTLEEGKRVRYYKAKRDAARDLAIEAGMLASKDGYEAGVAAALALRAAVEMDAARYDESVALFRKSLEIRERLLGKDDPETAKTYNGLGAVHMRKGELDPALSWFQKALDVRAKVLGEDHPTTAASHNNVGNVHLQKGELDAALASYKRALAIQERALGKEHPSTAASYNNLGVVYSQKRDVDAALEWFTRAVAVHERVFGKDHPDTATSYGNLGSAYDDKKAYDDALTWHRRALEIRERVLGKDHPATASSYSDIGVVYDHKGALDEALSWYTRAADIDERALGKDHASTAAAWENIGHVHEKKRAWPEAIEWLHKAEAADLHRAGDAGPDTVRVRAAIADLCAKHPAACAPAKR